MSGLQVGRVGRGIGLAGGARAGRQGRCRNRSVRTPRPSRRRTGLSRAGKKLADQEKFKREQHPFDAYPRLKEQAETQRAAVAGGQFPLALLRPVLCRAGAELLHVPAADSERHSQALAVRGRRRSRRKLWRRLFARHHPRQYPDPRDPAEAHRGADRGHPGSRTVLARLRRRQHPQRHGHADRRHRSAGIDRHPRHMPANGTITSSTTAR